MDVAELKSGHRRWPLIVAALGTVGAGVGTYANLVAVPCLIRRYSVIEAVGLSLAGSLMWIGPLMGWIATPIVATKGKTQPRLRRWTWGICGVLSGLVLALYVGVIVTQLLTICGSGQIPSDFPSVLGLHR